MRFPIFVFVLVPILLAACGGPRSVRPRPAADDPSPAPVVTAPAPADTLATGTPISWDLAYLVPACGACRTTLDYHAPRCVRCGRDCLWAPPELPNTPEGAFAWLKLAALYDDIEFYRNSLVAEEFARMERSVRLGEPSPMGDRGQAVDTRVTRVVPEGDAALLMIEYRGYTSQIEARVEEGRWKISLARTANDARIAHVRDVLKALRTAVEQRRAERQSLPAAGNLGLVAALSQLSTTGQPYFWFDSTRLAPDGQLFDVWGNPFRFVPEPVGNAATPATGYRLYSVGPDGIDEQGLGDDIQ